MRFLILLFCLVGGSLFAEDSGVDLTINVTNIKEIKGVIRIGLFKTEDDYKKKINQVRKGTYPVVEKKLTVKYEKVPAGFYAIILFHDLNENDRNDSNALGMPLEPFGLSNNIKPGLGLPPFAKTKFEVADKNISVDVELQKFKKKWSLGVAVLTTVSPYVESKPHYLPLPIITYQGDKLDVLATQVHYSLWRNEKWDISLGAKLNFDGYNSDYSYIFEGMSDRKLTIEGGLKLQYHWNKNWTLQSDGYYDMLNVSNGFNGSLFVARSFGNDKWKITPSLGVHWEDENYVDYYYGVKNSEVNSDRFEYHPGFSINPFLECTYIHFWGDSWATYIRATGNYLDKEIQNSPLVDKAVSFAFLMAFVYRF